MYIFLPLLLFTSLSLFLFSYLFIDYAIILSLAESRPYLLNFTPLITFTNANRYNLANIYILIIFILFILQIFFLTSKSFQNLSAKSQIILFTIPILILSFSYPFLSLDIFTYIFTSKIILNYHINPYAIPPKAFLETDFWVGFLRNIDLTYQYGFIHIVYALIPALLFSANKLILNFFGIKLLNALLFLLTGYLLYKLTKDKKIFSIWFLSPLLIIELLVNAHNDLLMINLFIISLYFFKQKKYITTGLFFFLSVFTKYVSILAIPTFYLSEKYQIIFLKVLSLLLILYFQLNLRPIQIWYYTWLFMFLPFLKLKTSSWIIINLIGLLLLLNYYPFIQTNYWGNNALMKNLPIWMNLLLTLIILLETNVLNKYLPKSLDNKI